MIRVEVTSVLPLPTRQTFAFITNVMNWSRYWPDFVRLEHAGAAPRWAVPGDRITVVQRLLGREVALHLQLDAFRPDFICYRSQQAGLPDAIHERHFRAAADGCEYRLVVVYQPRTGWRGLVDRVILKHAVRRALRQTVRNLRSQFHRLGEGPAMPSSTLVKTMPRRRGVLLAFLLGIVMVSPLLLHANSAAWIPRWSGAAISAAALLGVLCVFWRAGELRGVLLVSFIVALTLAALTGWLLARAT
jgi:Polyketide cyclase / dehydrase and lipid transport